MVLGGRTFGRCLGNEGGALLNGIMKKTPQGFIKHLYEKDPTGLPRPFCPVRTQQETGS